MPFELPLFPLNVVLFPGMQLPLHIFEPRYRLMTRRVLEADAMFGVSLLIEGAEGQSETYPAPVGCSAEIIENTAFPDGRMNLLTVGRRRFRILAVREEDDYLIGTCEWIEEVPEPAPIDKARRVRDALRTYLMSLARNANLSIDDFDDLDVPADPYGLSMWVAALISVPNAQKQELLEVTSTLVRLEAEAAFLRRGEIVQRAYNIRQAQMKPESEDEEPGPFSHFISLN